VAPPAMVPGAIIVQGATFTKKEQFTTGDAQEAAVILILVPKQAM